MDDHTSDRQTDRQGKTLFTAFLILVVLCQSSVHASEGKQACLAPKSHYEKPHSHAKVARVLSDKITAHVLVDLSDDSSHHDMLLWMNKYSQYKLGSSYAVAEFGEQLSKIIEEQCELSIRANSGNWVILTQPYTSVRRSIQALGDYIAKRLQISHIPLRQMTTESLIRYSSLTTFSERMAARGAIKFEVPDGHDLRGKSIILLDDMINTGVSILAKTDTLFNKYGVAAINTFGILSLRTSRPQLEEQFNSSFVQSGDLAGLAAILNHPDTNINQYMLETFLKLDEIARTEVASGLTPSALRKVHNAVREYTASTSSHRIRHATIPGATPDPILGSL